MLAYFDKINKFLFGLLDLNRGLTPFENCNFWPYEKFSFLWSKKVSFLFTTSRNSIFKPFLMEKRTKKIVKICDTSRGLTPFENCEFWPS